MYAVVALLISFFAAATPTAIAAPVLPPPRLIETAPPRAKALMVELSTAEMLRVLLPPTLIVEPLAIAAVMELVMVLMATEAPAVNDIALSPLEREPLPAIDIDVIAAVELALILKAPNAVRSALSIVALVVLVMVFMATAAPIEALRAFSQFSCYGKTTR